LIQNYSSWFGAGKKFPAFFMNAYDKLNPSREIESRGINGAGAKLRPPETVTRDNEILDCGCSASERLVFAKLLRVADSRSGQSEVNVFHHHVES